jgi:hypothetical protein
MHKYGRVATDDYRDKGLKRDNTEAREEVPKHKCNEDGDVKVDGKGKNSDFRFQSYCLPHCKLDTHDVL